MATKRREILGLTDADMGALIEDRKDLVITMIGDPEATLPMGCLAKADLDEPLFILRGADRCAPGAVRDWVQRARNAGGTPEAKLAEAMDIAFEMEQWQNRTGRAKWPD